MGFFRFQRRIGPKGLKINLSKKGFSSISFGGPGLSVNVPVERKGGVRTTVGLPGSGLSYISESRDRENNASGLGTAITALMGLSVLGVIIFVLASANPSSQSSGVKTRGRASSKPSIPVANKDDISVSDVVIGPGSWSNDYRSKQSTGVFVYYTLTNNSQTALSSIRGSVTVKYEGKNRIGAGTPSLFYHRFDKEDKTCLMPGESYLNEGAYVPRSNWANDRWKYTNPVVRVDSVDTELFDSGHC